MRRPAIALAAISAGLTLNGCAAALLPIAAASAVGARQAGLIGNRRPRPDAASVGDAAAPAAPRAAEAQATPPAEQADEPAPADIPGANVSPTTQPENLAALAEPYQQFVRFALARQRDRLAGMPINAVLLEGRDPLARQEFAACDARPSAVTIDLDPADGWPADWAVSADAPPGLASALAQLRQAGIAIFWISTEGASHVALLADRLRASGLDADGDDWLFVVRNSGERRQTRLEDAGRDYCIIAMAGDRNADFHELYDYLRNPGSAFPLQQYFGEGWFIVPPPLGNASSSPHIQAEEDHALDPR